MPRVPSPPTRLAWILTLSCSLLLSAVLAAEEKKPHLEETAAANSTEAAKTVEGRAADEGATDEGAKEEGTQESAAPETRAVECPPATLRRTAEGLRVYVDPVTGALTSNPPPRPRGLRVIESQSRPPTGSIEREVVEIPGVGIGIFVGDLFVHSMKVRGAPIRVTCPAPDPDTISPAPRQGSLPVAVQ
ncbi:MAG: hypothetical protein AAF690_00490 [Acidobacteriota bacterium]